jgi:PBSX family phage terminase large subunit
MATKTLRHSYTPRGVAKRAFECTDDELVLSGPAGTGKSRACLEKLHFVMLLNPGARGLIVRKTATSLTSTALVTFRERVLPEALTVGDVKWYGGSAQEAAQYRYSNGSVITVGGLDRATRIMSSEYDVIYVQEATELSENDWEALTTRLRHGRVAFQQLIADCNPDAPTHWLKARADRGAVTMLESRHTDNPTIYTDDGDLTASGAAYMAKLDALTGVRRQRLRDGLWVAAEGVIYEDYDPAVHLIDRFEIPADWTRWWAVDFGYTNPFVCQRWAEDPDGRLYLYAETYHTRRTVDQHAERILSEVTDIRGDWIEPKPRAVVCDHDAEGREVFGRAVGLSTTPANKKVLDGIQAVQRRLRRADNKPRLFLLRDSVSERDPELIEARRPACTAEELPAYVWQDGGKEAPVKQDDHGADCLRYIVAERDLGGRPRVRWA